MSVDPNPAAASANVNVGSSSLTWDELFPAGVDPAAQGATTPQGGTQPQSQAPATQTPATASASPVIQTKTGTVYKTIDDATKGIEHKDTVIADMRQRYILATGIDPLTGQPAMQGVGVHQPTNYMQDKKRFFDDLSSAASKNDVDGVWNAQTKLIFDALAPLAPVMGNLAKQQAVEQLSSEIPDVREFMASDNYKKALTETPDLQAAIASAESNYEHYGRLPGLYKVAYRVSQGLRLPEILRSQAPASASQPVRQTTAASTLTPTTQTGFAPSLYTKEGRKALQAQLEAKGVADAPLV